MTKLDISPEHLAKVLQILNHHVPEYAVWAFGSRVRGDAHHTSDLDLAIIGETPIKLAQLAALREAFQESSLPFKVDIVDWATTNTAFQDIIRHTHMILKNAD